MTPLLLIPVAAAGAFLYFKSKKSSAENLRADFRGVAIDSKETAANLFMRLVYSVKVQITNPDRSAVNVKGIFLNVFLNGKKIGTVEKLDKFAVPARSAQDIKLTGSILTLGAINTIKDIILNPGKRSLSLQISGFIDTDLGRLTLDQQPINI